MMKKAYAKPLIEIETYELSASIAQSCGNNLTLGPGTQTQPVCKEYEGDWDVFSIVPGIGVMSTGGKPFYTDTPDICDCYVQSGNGILFSS